MPAGYAGSPRNLLEVARQMKIETYETALGGGKVMLRACDGGPIRFGVTGRKHNTTHIHNSAKVPNHILPAESDAELQVMMLLDISTSALTYMAQPHTLKFPRPGIKGKWRYTPDYEVVVPRWFVAQLEANVPFAVAALRMPQRRAAGDDLVPLVLEIKGAAKYAHVRPDSPSARDLERAASREARRQDYEAKLAEVRAIYHEIGYSFHLVEEARDLGALDLRHLPSILMDDDVTITRHDAERAWEHLKARNGLTTYDAMIEALGGGPFGREKANCLHVRGLIWINLVSNPQRDCQVAMPPLLGGRQSHVSLLDTGRP